MSNRVLKKLQGVNDIGKLDAQSETEDEAPNVAASDARKSRQAAANRFELLTGLSAEQSLSDTAKEDDDRENEPPLARAAPQEGPLLADEAPRSKLEKQDSTQSTDSLKRRKKKKKKKKQLNSQHSHEDRLHHAEIFMGRHLERQVTRQSATNQLSKCCNENKGPGNTKMSRWPLTESKGDFEGIGKTSLI